MAEPLSYSIDLPYFYARFGHGAYVTRGTREVSLGHDIAAGTDEPSNGIHGAWRWDGERLTAGNDRFGVYPLYYFANDKEVCISPSLVRLLEEGAPNELDYAALATFLHLGFFLGEDTAFKHIRAMPPNAAFEWTREGLSVKGHRPAFAARPISRDEAIDEYISLFRRGVERRRPEGDYIMPLSGGRDSRHILLELCRMGCPPRQCITSLKDPNLSSRNKDTRLAPEVAARLGIPHRFFTEQPSVFKRNLAANFALNFCSGEQAWQFDLYTYLNENTPVCYDGAAALLSHSTYVTREPLDLFAKGRWEELAEVLLRQWSKDAILSGIVDPDHRDLFSRDMARDRVFQELKRHDGAANPLIAFYFWNRTRRQVAMLPHMLMKDLKAVYMPFLDNHVVDLMLSLPPDLTLDRKFHSQAINRAFPQYASIPFSQDVKTVKSKFDIFMYRSRYFANFLWFISRHQGGWKFLDRNMLLRTILSHFHPARARLDQRFLPNALYLLQLGHLTNNRAGGLGNFACRLVGEG